MPKKTFTATAPDGSQHTRTSSHDYTHAVLVYGPSYPNDKRPQPESWGVLSFNSRIDLAQKEANKWADLYPVYAIVAVA